MNCHLLSREILPSKMAGTVLTPDALGLHLAWGFIKKLKGYCCHSRSTPSRDLSRLSIEMTFSSSDSLIILFIPFVQFFHSIFQNGGGRIVVVI